MSTTATPKPRADKVETFTQILRVDLTRQELAERADKAAHMYAQIRQKEEDLKAATKRQEQLELVHSRKDIGSDWEEAYRLHGG